MSSATESMDALGDVLQSWSTVDQPWANVEHLDGTRFEKLVTGQDLAEAETLFLVRYSSTLSGIGSRHRIAFGGDVFDVIGAFPRPAGRPREIAIYGRRRRDARLSAGAVDQSGAPILDQSGAEISDQ